MLYILSYVMGENMGEIKSDETKTLHRLRNNRPKK
jgi:hypothetical protein